ncbi:MAG TPA: hypothetical protein VJ485_03210 [archaeon]|jgi:hypothetical protein|nr:hypothetical protein [archaeon]
MLELALLIVLVGSVCFLTYEFWKVYSLYEKRMHYYRFLPSLSLPEVTKELDRRTASSESKMELHDIQRRMGEMQAKMERQQAVMEKVIKGLGE